MKRLTAILFLLFLSLSAMAQLEVKKGSFKEVPGFVNINPDENYQTDDNELPFAVIKVRTENITAKQRKELSFKGNAGTFIMLEYKDGEVWVYLTAKYADYLKISHPDFSSIEYTLPFDLQPKKGYEMTLVNKTNMVQELTISSNWVVINVTPKNAIVNIDGNYCPNGKAMIAIDEPHKLEISHPLYHSYESTVYSDASKKMTYDVKLEPAFGFLKIDSKPESGATVLINGVRRGVTPFLSDTLASGEYDVTLLLNMYKNVSQKLVVTDNNVTEKAITMSPNFAEVSVTTDSNSDIYIDDSKVGTGTWSGRLFEGGHIIEAKKASHKNSAMSVDITSGKAESIKVPAPTPIYGALNINSEPDEATVFLDGESIGETPMIKNNVLIGEHRLVFSKEGYETLTKAVNVEEGKMANVNGTMTKNASSTAKSNTNTAFNPSSDTGEGEGMWLPYSLNGQNLQELQQLGCKLTAEQIFNFNQPSLKDAIVQFGGGCTGAMISSEGLLITNYHCGLSYVQKHATVEHDYLTDGFWTHSKAEELPNPGLTVSLLAFVEDMTEAVLEGVTDEETRSEIIDKNIDKIIKERKGERDVKIEIVPFYASNQYILFEYDVYRDVRLVFCPPWSIGKFGTDTDNWQWPGEKGDFCIFRVYSDKNGKPAAYSENNIPYKPKYHFHLSLKGIKEGDLTMVMGYPGSTARYSTSYTVKNLIESDCQSIINCRTTKLNEYHKHMDADQEVFIKYASKQAGVSNYWKYAIGQRKHLVLNNVYDKCLAQEAAFKEWVNADAARKKVYGDIFEGISEKWNILDDIMMPITYLREAGWNGGEAVSFSRRFMKINNLINSNGSKEDIANMAEGLKAQTTAFFKDYDKALDMDVTIALLNLFYKDIDRYVPTMIAEIGTKNGGDFTAWVTKAFEKSIFVDQAKLEKWLANPKKLDKDPIFALTMNIIDEYANVVYPLYEEAGLLGNAGERLYMKGLMEMQPERNFYPDANFTMRLSYGTIKNYISSTNQHYIYYSTGNDMIKKYKPGDWEFDIPQKLINLINLNNYGQYANEKGELPVTFITRADITGGSSGSPVINSDGDMIGLVFDQNIEGTVGDIKYISNIRTKCVDIRYVLFIIDKFAGAKNIIDELALVK